MSLKFNLIFLAFFIYFYSNTTEDLIEFDCNLKLPLNEDKIQENFKASSPETHDVDPTAQKNSKHTGHLLRPNSANATFTFLKLKIYFHSNYSNKRCTID